MDYTKLHMYGQFTKALIVKDTTIDLVSKGELCAWFEKLLSYIETCNQEIEGLNREIEHLRKLNNNQAKMLLNKP